MTEDNNYPLSAKIKYEENKSGMEDTTMLSKPPSKSKPPTSSPKQQKKDLKR